jgi:cobalt-zinc-cadmium efflux system membrane fusion protein
VFDAKITTIGATVDPNTRRVLVRSQINDLQHELRSGI